MIKTKKGSRKIRSVEAYTPEEMDNFFLLSKKKRNASKRRYMETHPEEVAAAREKDVETHPEEVRESAKKWRTENPEKRGASKKKYEEKNKDKKQKTKGKRGQYKTN